jgi:hypothetical protein
VFATSAVQSVARRGAQHQKKTDHNRRERKQGSIKAVATDLRRDVVHCQSRRDASSDGGEDHELIVVSDGPSEDDVIPDTRHAPLTRGQRPIIPKGRLATLLAAEIGRVNLNIDVVPEGICEITPFFSPGCRCHLGS